MSTVDRLQEGFHNRAAKLNIDVGIKPPRRVVMTGFASITALGWEEQTWNGLLTGQSSIRKFPVGNHRSNIAGPVDWFNPADYFMPKELRWMSLPAAEAVVSSGRALNHSGLGVDGVLDPKFNRDRIGSWVGSAYAASYKVVQVYNTIHEKDARGNEDVTLGSSRVRPSVAIQLMPEELNGDVARALGLSGWGGNDMEACGTGLANPVEAARAIRDGLIDIAVAGAYEDLLDPDHHPETSIGTFTSLDALSKRNDDPRGASRPFDRDRDGFVPASGGATVIFEELEHAKKRGATIYGEVFGFNKSMDGKSRTELDPRRVAGTILAAAYNPRTHSFENIDGILAHATSTPLGDSKEAQALLHAFGQEYLDNTPVTAIKSMLGHLLGGAGSINLVTGLQVLRDGKMPYILNLKNPDYSDPKDTTAPVPNLYLVRDQVLLKPFRRLMIVAYGFGGYNAAMTIGPYEEQAA